MAVTIQIIGAKNTGKTLVVTRLIDRLTTDGYRFAAIKHDAHASSMDVPGTDSYQMSAAGAHQVVLESNNQFFFHQQGSRPALSKMVARLAPDNDVIIIEGHKAAPYPKVCLLDEEHPGTLTATPALIRTGRVVKYARVDKSALSNLVAAIYTDLKHQMEDGE